MAWWPTEPGQYTARRWVNFRYQRRHATPGAVIVGEQYLKWRCWLEDGKRITKFTARVS